MNWIKRFFGDNSVVIVDDEHIKRQTTKKLLKMLDDPMSLHSGNRIVKEILERIINNWLTK